jgi:hypothetical protein
MEKEMQRQSNSRFNTGVCAAGLVFALIVCADVKVSGAMSTSSGANGDAVPVESAVTSPSAFDLERMAYFGQS